MFPLLLILFLGLQPGLGPSRARSLNVRSSVGPSLAKGCPPIAPPLLSLMPLFFCPFIHDSIFHLVLFFFLRCDLPI